MLIEGQAEAFGGDEAERVSGRVGVDMEADGFVRNFEIHLGPVSEDDLFRRDSTFRFVQGVADPSGVSFESLNFPGRYVRHRDFLLWLEALASTSDGLFRQDATFLRRPAAVRIDEGTALNPVDD